MSGGRWQSRLLLPGCSSYHRPSFVHLVFPTTVSLRRGASSKRVFLPRRRGRGRRSFLRLGQGRHDRRRFCRRCRRGSVGGVALVRAGLRLAGRVGAGLVVRLPLAVAARAVLLVTSVAPSLRVAKAVGGRCCRCYRPPGRCGLASSCRRRRRYRCRGDFLYCGCCCVAHATFDVHPIGIACRSNSAL